MQIPHIENVDFFLIMQTSIWPKGEMLIIRKNRPLSNNINIPPLLILFLNNDNCTSLKFEVIQMKQKFDTLVFENVLLK